LGMPFRKLEPQRALEIGNRFGCAPATQIVVCVMLDNDKNIVQKKQVLILKCQQAIIL
jgi:hypothetical protein